MNIITNNNLQYLLFTPKMKIAGFISIIKAFCIKNATKVLKCLTWITQRKKIFK